MHRMMYGYSMGYERTGTIELIFSVLIIIGLALLIRFLWKSSEHKIEKESAFEILQKRYARGEIDKEEFQDKKKDLV